MVPVDEPTTRTRRPTCHAAVLSAPEKRIWVVETKAQVSPGLNHSASSHLERMSAMI
jgi:hypothetical protein